jgi:hypothetical protein
MCTYNKQVYRSGSLRMSKHEICNKIIPSQLLHYFRSWTSKQPQFLTGAIINFPKLIPYSIMSRYDCMSNEHILKDTIFPLHACTWACVCHPRMRERTHARTHARTHTHTHTHTYTHTHTHTHTKLPHSSPLPFVECRIFHTQKKWCSNHGEKKKHDTKTAAHAETLLFP